MSQSDVHQRIYVVDDEQVIAWSLATILRREGYDATFFDEPIKALHAARAIPPDLLVTDVVMPLLSGIELAIDVRAHSPACEIILLSGQAVTMEMIATAGRQGHRFEVVSKPVHPSELVRKIKLVLHGEPGPVVIH